MAGENERLDYIARIQRAKGMIETAEFRMTVFATSPLRTVVWPSRISSV